jgi:hypothetical protein
MVLVHTMGKSRKLFQRCRYETPISKLWPLPAEAHAALPECTRQKDRRSKTDDVLTQSFDSPMFRDVFGSNDLD